MSSKYMKALCDTVQHLPMFRADQNNAVWARHLLVSTLSELFRQEYTETKWANGELIPVGNWGVNEGANEFAYTEIGYAGDADIVASNATDIPDATVTGDLTVQTVQTVACSFSYSTQEVRASRMQGQFSIAAEKAAACREFHAQRMNTLIRVGNQQAGLQGFTNHSGIIVQNAVVGSWLTATAAQITNDFSTAAAFIRTNSNGVENPNYCVMPVDIFTRLSTLQNSIASDITVLMYLERAWPDITFAWDDGMKTASAAGADALMIYRNSPEKARAVVPMLMRPLSVEARGLVFKVVVESRYAGLAVPKPLSVLRLDGI